jgi:hypothetical protein
MIGLVLLAGFMIVGGLLFVIVFYGGIFGAFFGVVYLFFKGILGLFT